MPRRQQDTPSRSLSNALCLSRHTTCICDYSFRTLLSLIQHRSERRIAGVSVYFCLCRLVEVTENRRRIKSSLVFVEFTLPCLLPIGTSQRHSWDSWAARKFLKFLHEALKFSDGFFVRWSGKFGYGGHLCRVGADNFVAHE